MMTKLPKEVAEYFPYSTVRPFQDEFIKTVFSAVENRCSVLIEGSNGLGKTISALSACLPTTIENDLKILYVARTHRQHDRVIEELKAICKKTPVSGISLRGRHEMCLNEFASRRTFDAKSLMEVCEMLKAKDRCPFYTNMEENTEDFLQVQQQITSHPCKASEIQKICRKKALCPYELIKASLSEFKVIALSYLYVFDPVIRTSFLKNLDTDFQKVILVVDEAHNLPDTAIEIASSGLSLFVLKQAEFEARKIENSSIASFAKLLRNELETIAASIDKETIIPPETLIDIIKKQGDITKPRDFFEHMHEVGSFIKRSLLAEGKTPRSYIHGMSEFMLKWLETLGDESFINIASTYMSREKTPTAKLEIVALDPSKITAPVFSSAYASVVMSGTLQPLEAYARITKLPENTVKHIAPSPFPKEHVLSVVCLGVTTAMEKRIPTMYQTIIKRVNEVVQNTHGNTGIFAASFGVLNALIAEGLAEALEKPLFRERRGMSSKANERMVSEFKAQAERGGAVFLGVQGGRTSEGVDFPGNQMNSVIIVGVPYAEPTPRVKAQIEYYEKCFPRLGREYGYILPAMKKASQAAGRPIRTLEDRGAIVFLDYRFATNYCRSFLPSWISKGLKILPDQDDVLAQEIQGFFKR
ncbi:MAG: DNA repair helicase [Candidatus Bathyarchaeota archaeon]|nr:DNA repair helicase [Candidatus Bathyarchaeota archaeon]